MSKVKTLNREAILAIASEKEFCVGKYSYRHEQIRRVCRRMAGDGLLRMTRQDGRNFYFRAVTS